MTPLSRDSILNAPDLVIRCNDLLAIGSRSGVLKVFNLLPSRKKFLEVTVRTVITSLGFVHVKFPGLRKVAVVMELLDGVSEATRKAPQPSPLAPKSKSKTAPSPDWDISSQDFQPSPTRTPEGGSGTPEATQSPFLPSHTPTPSPSPSEEDHSEHDADDLVDTSSTNPVQAHNARSPRWLAWQDRALIQEVENHRPFNAPRGDASKKAWETLAMELLKDTTANGTAVNRTAQACRARFQKLLKSHMESLLFLLRPNMPEK
ncbi:hypothetical protein B0H11DRAFT_1916990 [Mycena galericulata]|nr:hypothetical protein B0H11DRAFT_1916990 [Mycena galericulata]